MSTLFARTFPLSAFRHGVARRTPRIQVGKSCVGSMNVMTDDATPKRTFSEGKLEKVKELPLIPKDMNNESLLIVSYLSDDIEAKQELLARHIMDVDKVNYDEALEKCNEIEQAGRKIMLLHTVPYKIGIAGALITGFGSIPMVFDVNVALWFNENFVTTDVASDEDLETYLEVGAWTWNWMEPVLGTASFTLLALQFSRAQLENLAIRPFTRMLRHKRGLYLVQQYPQYNAKLLSGFGKLITYYK